MDNAKALLLAELPGLEAAKTAIDARIEQIRRDYHSNNPSAAKNLAPINPSDTSVIGRDTIGRIIRKRTISPELRAAKIAQIGMARKLKLDRIRAAKEEAEKVKHG